MCGKNDLHIRRLVVLRIEFGAVIDNYAAMIIIVIRSD